MAGALLSVLAQRPVPAAGPLGAPVDGISFVSPPTLVRDVVVLGGTGSLKFRHRAATNGAARAFDARTGAPKRTFDPIPRDPADPLHASWTPAALQETGGAEPWTTFAVDAARDLVFVPTSSPAPDFNGVGRPGDNRYANSLVALRGSTGEVVWHFQVVHHDIWDLDVPAQPILTELDRDGRQVPVVIQLTKVGMVFVFERETGRPFFPIEERAVPTDGVPGDVLSPTQPFTVKPAPLVRQSIGPDDAWGVAPPFKNACREQIAAARHGPSIRRSRPRARCSGPARRAA